MTRGAQEIVDLWEEIDEDVDVDPLRIESTGDR
jgi:hypothetical protein